MSLVTKLGVGAVAAAGILLSNPAKAAVVWNETLQGDLSGNRTTPTLIPVLPGDNDVIGAIQSGDLDYVRIDVLPNTKLTSIVVKSYQGVDQTSFIGLQQGPTFTVDSFAAAPEDMYGYAHFFPGAGDILDDMGTAFGAQGFTPPLNPGSYTFWIQQLGSATNYDLNFTVVAVPEPSGALIGIGVLACSARRRVRSRRA
jgi:hypothetical protein